MILNRILNITLLNCTTEKKTIELQKVRITTTRYTTDVQQIYTCRLITASVSEIQRHLPDSCFMNVIVALLPSLFVSRNYEII